MGYLSSTLITIRTWHTLQTATDRAQMCLYKNQWLGPSFADEEQEQ